MHRLWLNEAKPEAQAEAYTPGSVPRLVCQSANTSIAVGEAR
jgi:hypothetical protein